MNDKEQVYFKNKLLNEKDRVNELLEHLKRNDVINSNEEMAQEISFYDNHTGDLGEELFNKEKSIALKDNEYNILKKIDGALDSLEKGTYGVCESCRKIIPRERLEFLPYATYCVNCQESKNSLEYYKRSKDTGEDVLLKKPFIYGFNDRKDEVGFDGEDSLQAVDRFNQLPDRDEFYEDDNDYVEPIEAISNEDYKKQLPD